jgi:hypothetical protein
VKRSILGIVLVLTFVAVGIAAAPKLTFTFSDVKTVKTASETDSYSVNNAGVITGDYIDSAGVQHGFTLAGTKLTTINNKACSSSLSFYGINSAGTLAGWCIASSGDDIAFTWAKGKFTTIAYPKAVQTEATGINDKGDVTGLYFDTAGVQHGFLKVGKKYTAINVKGATSTDAYGINNAGDIAVYAITSAGDYASYLYNGKTFKVIADPKQGTLGTVAHKPNNKGDITGTYFNSANDSVGFLLHSGKYYDLLDPKANASTRADGLNDTLESWAVIPVPAAPRLVLKPQLSSSLCASPLQCSLELEAAEAAGVETSSCSASYLLLCQVVVNRGAPLFSAVAVRGSHFPHALVGFGIQSSSLVRDIHIRILWVGLREANVNEHNHRLRNEVNVLEMSGVGIKGSVDPIRMMMTMADGEHRALGILRGLGIEESRIPVPVRPTPFALRPKQWRHNFVGSVNRELELVAHMRHGAGCRTAVTLVIKKCHDSQRSHGNQNQ